MAQQEGTRYLRRCADCGQFDFWRFMDKGQVIERGSFPTAEEARDWPFRCEVCGSQRLGQVFPMTISWAE